MSAVALAAGTVLLGGAVAAQAAPAADVTFTVSRLVLQPGESGHTGRVRVVIRNKGSEPFSGGFSITEPIAGTLGTIEGGAGCGLNHTPDNRRIALCPLDGEIAPGGSAVITASFESPARPQPYAQIAPQTGSVQIAGVTAEFPALFRSTTGSLRNPQPYVQDPIGALTVTAADVTLTRQPDGTFAGRVPVRVRNDSDAAHRELWTEIAAPAGLEGWPAIEPSDVCVGSERLPVPPGGIGVGCALYGGQLPEGEERTFEWVLTAPAETPAGPLGTATTLVDYTNPDVRQSDGANIDSFTITVAG
ncbi:hypothetical protein ACWEOZ_32130 [Actinoplanes sp. NPDC004185]